MEHSRVHSKKINVKQPFMYRQKSPFKILDTLQNLYKCKQG